MRRGVKDESGSGASTSTTNCRLESGCARMGDDENGLFSLLKAASASRVQLKTCKVEVSLVSGAATLNQRGSYLDCQFCLETTPWVGLTSISITDQKRETGPIRWKSLHEAKIRILTVSQAELQACAASQEQATSDFVTHMQALRAKCTQLESHNAQLYTKVLGLEAHKMGTQEGEGKKKPIEIVPGRITCLGVYIFCTH